MDKIKVSWRPYFMIALGCIIVTIAMNLFLIPYKLAPGGVSGISTVIYYLIGGKISVGMLMLIFNVPLFITGLKSRGRQFLVRSLFGAVILSVMIDGTATFFNWLVKEYLVRFDESMAIPDMLLNSVVGGSIMGFGLGIVLKEDATTGGTDLAAALLKKYIPRFSIGQYLFLLDGCVIIFATLAFRSIKLGIYAAVGLYLSSKTIDAFLEGINFAKSLFIISDYSQEIADRLLNEVDRGVTGIKGTGMYSKKDKSILLCVVKREEIPVVKEIVKDIDPKAFILLMDTREVLGEGFLPLYSSKKQPDDKGQ